MNKRATAVGSPDVSEDERQPMPGVHAGTANIIRWAGREPTVETMVRDGRLLLAFVGLTKSVGWAEVDASAGTFRICADRLKGYKPFQGRGGSRLVKTFAHTTFWRRGNVEGWPPYTLDGLADSSVWAFVESRLNLIVACVKELLAEDGT